MSRPSVVCVNFAISTWLLCAGCGTDVPEPPQNPVSTTNDTTQPNITPPLTNESPGATVPVNPVAPLLPLAPTPPVANQNNSKPTRLQEVSDDAATVSTALFRLPDNRPDINEERLRQAGVQRYEGRRLILLSDLPADDVRHLPELADGLFTALEAHFGSLPEATDQSPFQVTGCLIGDEDRFRRAGLMPDEGFTFKHGRHRNYEFWMYNPKTDYYRRHLLLHEFTHCFMTCESGMLNIPPLWYIEGMAEFFATHQRRDDVVAPEPQMNYGVLPAGFEGFDGWGRISEMRRSYQRHSTVANEPMTMLNIAPLSEVMPRDVGPYFESDFHYASAWALCWMLNRHPTYRDAFRPLAQIRTQKPFRETVNSICDSLQPRLSIDWLLFVEDLIEGYDTQRSWPQHAADSVTISELTANGPLNRTLSAENGWQDTGLRLKPTESVRISCEGRYQINQTSKPWISEPQGVSIEYVRDLPLGQVIAILVGADGESLSQCHSVGRTADITSSFAASLWLQINDTSNSRGNNTGHTQITLTAVP
ncbi:MAG: hypothetical protein R3C59_28915 [Planctomycetaceae bacterium]